MASDPVTSEGEARFQTGRPTGEVALEAAGDEVLVLTRAVGVEHLGRVPSSPRPKDRAFSARRRFADDPSADSRERAADQGDTLSVERRPPGSSPLVGPTAPDDSAMPAEERLGRDRKGRPALARKGAAQRCEQRPIRGSIPRRLRLTAQNAELVAQHEDLELVAIARAAEQDQEFEAPAKSQEQKRKHASPPVRWQRRGKLADSDGR